MNYLWRGLDYLMNNYEITIKIAFTDKDTIANLIRDNGMLFTVLSDVLDIDCSQIKEVQEYHE